MAGLDIGACLILNQELEYISSASYDVCKVTLFSSIISSFHEENVLSG